MINFQFVGFKTLQAIPVKFPMTNWIYAANDDVMYAKPQKY